MSKIKEILNKFYEKTKSFHGKTFEGCGTLVKNQNKDEQDLCPWIGNIKVEGKIITISGTVKENQYGKKMMTVKAYCFDEKIEEEEIDVDETIDDYFKSIKTNKT